MTIWTDKSGKEWQLWQMTDTHLANTRRMLLQAADDLWEQASTAWAYPGQGDMATYYADQAANQASEASSKARLMADLMLEEMERRAERWKKWNQK